MFAVYVVNLCNLADTRGTLATKPNARMLKRAHVIPREAFHYIETSMCFISAQYKVFHDIQTSTCLIPLNKFSVQLI